jgi:hypothetical protein
MRCFSAQRPMVDAGPSLACLHLSCVAKRQLPRWPFSGNTSVVRLTDPVIFVNMSSVANMLLFRWADGLKTREMLLLASGCPNGKQVQDKVREAIDVPRQTVTELISVDLPHVPRIYKSSFDQFGDPSRSHTSRTVWHLGCRGACALRRAEAPQSKGTIIWREVGRLSMPFGRMSILVFFFPERGIRRE